MQVTEALRKRPDSITQYVEFKGCGHVPMDERPEEFTAVVTPFVSEVISGHSATTDDAGRDGQAYSDFDASDQPLQAVEQMTSPQLDAIPS